MIGRDGNVLLIALVLVGIVAVVAATAAGYFYWQNKRPNKNESLIWEECIKTPGAIESTSYPATCATPDGRRVVQTLSDEEKKKLQPPNETANWKSYTANNLFSNILRSGI